VEQGSDGHNQGLYIAILVRHATAANLTLTCKAKLFSVRCKEGKDIRQAIRWRVIEAMDRHKATGDNM